MLRISLLDFLKTGQFGPLRLGVPGESLTALLGEPCSIDQHEDDDYNYELRRWGCLTATCNRQGRVNALHLFFIAANDYPAVSEKAELGLGGIDWPNMDVEGMEQLLNSLEVWHFRNPSAHGGCTVTINGTTGAVFLERDHRYMLCAFNAFDLEEDGASGGRRSSSGAVGGVMMSVIRWAREARTCLRQRRAGANAPGPGG